MAVVVVAVAVAVVVLVAVAVVVVWYGCGGIGGGKRLANFSCTFLDVCMRENTLLGSDFC